jgi:hypothetical protein
MLGFPDTEVLLAISGLCRQVADATCRCKQISRVTGCHWGGEYQYTLKREFDIYVWGRSEDRSQRQIAL